jgi:hypothetical protein
VEQIRGYTTLMNLLVRENDRILLANLFNTTKSGFLQRLLQSLGAFNQARGEATFQRFQVRQQYPVVFWTGGRAHIPPALNF